MRIFVHYDTFVSRYYYVPVLQSMTKLSLKATDNAISKGMKRSNKLLLASIKKIKPRSFKTKEKSIDNDYQSTTSEIIEEDLLVYDEKSFINKENNNVVAYDDVCYFEENITELQYSENVCSSHQALLENSENRVSAIQQRIPSFDIKKLAKHLTIISNKFSFVPADNSNFLKHDEGNVRKGTFARALHDWSLDYNVPRDGVDAFMNIIYHTFKGYELPAVVKKQGPKKQFRTLEEFKQLISLNNKSDDELVVEGLEADDASVDTDDADEIDENASLCTDDLTTSVVKATIHEYSQKPTRYVGVDQCMCDGYVYAGDNNQLFQCPECQVDRFRPCTRTLCPRKGYSDCEHLRSADGDGIAHKKLFYRPLLVLISDLLKTPYFLSSLRYERIQEISHHPHHSVGYSDLMDGDAVKHHLSIMHSRFKTWRNSKPDRLNNSEEVSLVLSEFYDGGQLFKSKTTNFWILMTQILNLPPTFRGKLGIGMFLSAIYSGKHLEAEKFLFTDMYCEELRLLNDGTELNLNGKKYFIQARLILHTLDTKALEAVLGLQSVGMALFGCPLCRSVTGVQDGAKCVYIGHRQLLPQHSYLRFLGQSGKCCPNGFYDNDKSYNNNETYEHGMESFSIEDHIGYATIRSSMQNGMIKLNKGSTKRKYSNTIGDDEELDMCRTEVWETVRKATGTKHLLQFCLPCDGNKKREDAIKKFLFVEDTLKYYWSNKPELWDPSIHNKSTGLRKYLIYRHFDLRPYKPYSRVKYSDHLENAIIAKGLNENNKTQSKKHSKGIQDVWCFDRLPYADSAQQVTWPLLHAVTGVIKLLINTMLGVKEVKESIINQTYADQIINGGIINDSSDDDDNNDDDKSNKEVNNDSSSTIHLSKSQKMKLQKEMKQAKFYSYRPLHSKSGQNPFVCTTADKKRCREWLQCIILPKGLGDDSWDMRKFIINDKNLIPGFMKMNQRLKLVSCFWDFIVFAMHGVEDQYKLFYKMVGVNLRKLQSNYFSLEDVEKLSRDIEEMVCIWEGLLPLKTCTFILHELIDLAPFIKNFGPPMGVSEYPGERAVGTLISRKLKCNAGGESYENLIVDRHIQYELRKLKKFYSKNDLSELNGACTYLDSGKCIYNGERYSLSKPESQTCQKKNSFVTLTDYELDLLVDTLLMEVERKYGIDNRDLCIEKSVVYNLECKRRSMKQSTKIGISDWLRIVFENKEEGFSIDEVRVAQNILSFQPSYFQNAIISGLEFQSRGSWQRETKAPKQSCYGSEKLIVQGSRYSELQYSFREKVNNSSWCILKQQTSRKLYAQINTFFQIQIGDASLDGHLVASVTCRNHSIIPKTNLVNISRIGSLNVDTVFVSLLDIYPSRVATIPFTKNWKAIKVRARTEFISTYSTSSRDAELKELIMFTLHPERLSFRMN